MPIETLDRLRCLKEILGGTMEDIVNRSLKIGINRLEKKALALNSLGES